MYDRFTPSNIAFCRLSHPAVPPDIIASAPVGYIRLHGIPKMFYSEYSPIALMKLHDAIISKNVFEQVFLYFNNTASTAGVLNAQELNKRFKS